MSALPAPCLATATNPRGWRRQPLLQGGLQLGLVLGLSLQLAASTAPPSESLATASAPRLLGFGDATQRRIVSSSPLAQAWFNQGLQQAFAFDEIEARRAFSAALAADPRCSMCAWGLAWQHGPSYNSRVRGDLGEARRYARLAQQLSLAHREAPLERALAEAMLERLQEGDVAKLPAATLAVLEACGPDTTESRQVHPLDRVFERRMRILSEMFPKDPELLAWWAEALFVIHPEPSGLDALWAGLSSRLLQGVALHPQHTGLIHYLSHAADSSADAPRAINAVQNLQHLAPASPHLQHMSSHLLVKLGRYAEAVQANQRGLAAQAQLDRQLQTQGFTAGINWNPHNQRFLWIAAQLGGDLKTSLAMAEQLAAEAPDGEWGDFLRGLPWLTLVHFERWRDILARPKSDGVSPPLLAHARGLARLRLGLLADARADVALLEHHLDEESRSSQERKPARVAFATLLLAPLQAEQAWSRGDAPAALATLREALRLEADMSPSEPPLWAASAQRGLGQMLLRTRERAAAIAAFEADLQAFPANQAARVGLAAAQALPR
ncbi:hypothetical protein LNV23_10950 [Paucibacter sp. DJ1R-11]|uniref:hypothetical protein n=1 Tax=Paucibacter sp. DJ1R-11 TaxID=2893556 RepID=UPI0021E373EC|nr:hypothetical protein [Paucibacter sp. DJ1R-11]MCV2363965.1 hypothetical protein [Paucibacter sp. DJ1R-11]